MQGYFHLAIAIGCLAIIYPKLLHPLLFSHLFPKDQNNGKVSYEKVISKSEELNPHVEQQFLMHANIRGQDGALPKIPLNKAEPRNPIQPKSSNAGTMAILLPIYGAGIAFYLIYTLAKVFGGKSKKYQEKKREFLKEHYRNFHYDVEKKEFRMGVTIPNDLLGVVPEILEEDSHAYIFSSGDGIKRSREENPHNTDQSDGCALLQNSLDLEEIIQKGADDITDSELICLKQKLVETEKSLALILETMNRVENKRSLDSSLNTNPPSNCEFEGEESVEFPDCQNYSYEEDELSDESENFSDNSEESDHDDEIPSRSESSTEIDSDPSVDYADEDKEEEDCESFGSEDESCDCDEEDEEDNDESVHSIRHRVDNPIHSV